VEGGQSRLRQHLLARDRFVADRKRLAQVLKDVFTRARPIQRNDPNAWFQGGSHYSFPSGEGPAVSSIVAPFVFEYGNQQPGVWALEALPLYDAIARMKVQAHWQTDVLAACESELRLGIAAQRDSPLVLSVMAPCDSGRLASRSSRDRQAGHNPC